MKEIEVPYELPEGWAWSRLKTTILVNPRNKLDDNMEVGFVSMPLIDGGFSPSHTSEVRTWNNVKSGYTHFQNNDVVMAKITPSFQNRKSAILKDLKNNFGAGTTEVYTLRPSSGIASEFLYYFIGTRQFILDGMKNFTGNVGQQRVPRYFVEEYLFPIPPTQEQIRIVNMIDKYLLLIESVDLDYESLNQLSEQLKKKVLETAMQGKLVPQDPSDEPASVLLGKIRAEKQRLYEAGKLKKKDLQESIIYKGDDNSYYEKFHDDTVKSIEIPYELPASWAWTRLGSIGSWISGATPKKSKMAYYTNGTIPWLLTGDLTDNFIEEVPNKITELALEETSVKLNPTGSILIAMYGATIGKLGILTFPSTTNQACCACQPYSGVRNDFLFYFLMSQKEYFIDKAEGGAQPNISRKKIIATKFILPPYEEQKLIVKRIIQQFTLIDAIKAEL